jgi:hypothetical protein
MAVAKIGNFINNTATRRIDRGGNSMNLISEMLLKLGFNFKRRKYKTEIDKNIDDYGYALYKSLEYDFKYLKSDDFGFRGNLLNTFLR